MKKTKVPGHAVAFAYVGNIGCIKFPPEIRKASGIKRGDRLSVRVSGGHAVVLEKLNVPGLLPMETLSVDGCTCQQVPQGCSRGIPEVVSVGWSYVKLGETLAAELGFLPEAPLKLVGETARISVSRHNRMEDLKGIAKLPCPP